MCGIRKKTTRNSTPLPCPLPLSPLPRGGEGGKYVTLSSFCFCLILLLTGCTTVSHSNVDQITPPVPTANLKIGKIQYWDIRGKIAVKTDRKGWNASFNWLQKQDNYFLSFFGPLGANRISLEGNRSYAMLQTGNQNFEASNAEVLLQRRLGWYLPVNNIYYWVRGLPAPGPCHKILRNSEHETLFIEQQGWRVTYSAYQMINGHQLPTLIELENPKLFIRIAIYRWDL